MAQGYVEGFEPIEASPSTYVEGFEPISTPSSPAASVNPLAEQQAIEQQYIASQQPDFLRTATTPLRLGYDTVAGLISSLTKGGKGAIDLAAQAIESETPIRTGVGNIAQTALEIVPQAAYGLADILRQAGTYTLQNPQGALRNISSVVNPIGTAIQESFAPPAAPSQAEIADAVMRQLVNQEYAAQGSQPMAPEIFGQASIPLAQAAPDLAATVLGAPELASLARGAISRIPAVATEAGKTGVTLISSPRTGYQAAGQVQPYLSGSKVAAAEESLSGALARQAAAERDVALEGLQAGATKAQEARTLAGQRGEAATSGREALAASRELRAGEAALQPQIITAQTTLDQVAQSPVVILGKTADEPAAFGRNITGSIAKPMEASKKVYTQAYDSVKESLPEVQPKFESPNLFEAAAASKEELSQGFQALNKGEIKQMLDESSKVTKAESKVPAEIQNLFDNATPQGKADLIKSYPELATVSGKVKRPKYNWDELQARFRQVNEGIDQAIKHGDTGDVRILSRLKAGIVDDMENYASQIGGDTFEVFREANKLFRDHEAKFGLNRIQSILKEDVTQNPQMVASKLVNDNNAPMVEAVKSIVTPEEFRSVQAQFAQKIFSPNVDTPFDPSHFIKNFSDRSTHETYKAVFGQQGFNQLQQIYEASKGFEKITDFQKTLDNLQKEAASTGEAFAKKRGRVTETEAVQFEKERLRKAMQPLKDADTAQKLGSSRQAVESARKELDRIKNYRELKDWATRASGLNILKAVFGSPAGISLNRRLASSGLLVATPNETEDLNAVIRNNNKQ